jgi:hypothetical protein
MHLSGYTQLRGKSCLGDTGDGSPHILPAGGSERFAQPFFGAFPMRLGESDLALPRPGQAKDAFPFVLARPYPDPALPEEGSQGAAQRRAVHREARAQEFLIALADFCQGSQQSELGNFQSGFAQLFVVDTGDDPGDPAKVLAGAGQGEEVVGLACQLSRLACSAHSRCIYI